MTDPTETTPSDPFADLRADAADLAAILVGADRLQAMIDAYDAAVEGLVAMVEGVDRSYPQMLHKGERRALDKAEAALARARDLGTPPAPQTGDARAGDDRGHDR